MKTFSDGTGLSNECAEEIKFVSSVASKFYSLGNMDDSAVVNLWRNVYKYGFLKKSQVADIKSAKMECSEQLSEKTWARLQALKIEQMDRNKKAD
jgi:hypothetical protein